MRAHIFYHGDMDGVVSAAMIVRLIGDDGTQLTPLSYASLGEDWDIYPFNPNCFNCILDFRCSKSLPQYSPVFLYADHHKTNWVPKETPTSIVLYDSTAPSCARVVYNAFPDPFFEELTEWADLVDSAKYENPRQALLCNEPALRIAAALKSCSNDARNELVRLLSYKEFTEVAKEPLVVEKWNKTVRREMRALEYAKRNAKVIGCVATIDYTPVPFTSRYAVFEVYPDILFSLYLRKQKGRYELSLSCNPWRPFVGVDLSEIAKMFGGGGHEKAAGITFPDVSSARKVMTRIARVLNEVLNAPE